MNKSLLTSTSGGNKATDAGQEEIRSTNIESEKQGSNLYKIVVVVAAAIAITALAFAIHYTVGFSALIAMFVANPIVAAAIAVVSLVAVGTVLWVVFSKSGTSENSAAGTSNTKLPLLDPESVRNVFLYKKLELWKEFTSFSSKTGPQYDQLLLQDKIAYLLALGEMDENAMSEFRGWNKTQQQEVQSAHYSAITLGWTNLRYYHSEDETFGATILGHLEDSQRKQIEFLKIMGRIK